MFTIRLCLVKGETQRIEFEVRLNISDDRFQCLFVCVHKKIRPLINNLRNID